MRFAFLCCLCCLLHTAASTQDRSALEKLLLLQDTRSSDRAALRSFLRSDNPVVEAQAALTAANLQDTTVLDDILPLLTAQSATVRENAALAFGQTAMVLSPSRLGNLDSLVLETLDRKPMNDRLVEECGKFGDASLLDSIVLRFFPEGRVPSRPHILGIARFAIRGIVTARSEHALLQLCDRPGQTRWETAYALQRAGDQPEVRHVFPRLRSLLESSDPLVRMNAAALAGKLHDFGPALELIRACLRDLDWRVRTNAARALVQWPETKPKLVLEDLLVPLRDRNPHVAIALLNALTVGNRLTAPLAKGALPEFVKAIDSIAAHARGNDLPLADAVFDLVAQLRGDNAATLLLTRAHPGSPTATFALSALGRTGSPRAFVELIRRWNELVPRNRATPLRFPIHASEACSAMQGLAQWAGAQKVLSAGARDSISAVYLQGLETNNIAVVATAADFLSDSLFRDHSSIARLRKALHAVRLPSGIEAAQQLVHTLRLLGDTDAVIPPLAPERTFSPAVIRALPDTVHVLLTTTRGSIEADLYRDAAPYTVASFVSLSRRGFFNSREGRAMVFHRVVPNFVVQGGDPRGDGWGGPGYSLRTEVSPLIFETGSIGMASAGKDTEGSQFFITHSPQPHLDGRYTVFGKVVGGMRTVDLLQAGDSILTVAVQIH